jgi:predicted amidohydrolase
MKAYRVACGQFAAEPGAKGANIARMIHYAAEAQGVGCDLILFPELIVTGYLAPEQIPPLAEPVTGPSVQALAKAARELQIGIVFGFAELDEAVGVRYNSLVVLDQHGELVTVYHKIHLWDTERQWAQGGDEVKVFDVGGMRCTGWICYDTRFPELARIAALGGADVALVATAWLGPGEEWELALRARALDNSTYVAGADIVSEEPGLRCRGLSMIVGPKGNVLARMEPGEDGIVCAALEPSSLDAQRGRVPLLGDRRPTLYGRLVE